MSVGSNCLLNTGSEWEVLHIFQGALMNLDLPAEKWQGITGAFDGYVLITAMTCHKYIKKSFRTTCMVWTLCPCSSPWNAPWTHSAPETLPSLPSCLVHPDREERWTERNRQTERKMVTERAFRWITPHVFYKCYQRQRWSHIQENQASRHSRVVLLIRGLLVSRCSHLLLASLWAQPGLGGPVQEMTSHQKSQNKPQTELLQSVNFCCVHPTCWRDLQECHLLQKTPERRSFPAVRGQSHSKWQEVSLWPLLSNWHDRWPTHHCSLRTTDASTATVTSLTLGPLDTQFPWSSWWPLRPLGAKRPRLALRWSGGEKM